MQRLFQVEPEDERPLAPGEEDVLLDFARENLPVASALLERLRQSNPARFRQRLQEQAPQLRHLRRLYERSPALGRILRQHIENMFETQRLIRELPRDTSPTDEQLAAIRAKMQANVNLEVEALNTLAAELESTRDERITRRVDALLADAGATTEEPEELKAATATYFAATSEAARAAAAQQVRAAVEQQMTREIARLRQRSAALADDVAGETERRLQRLLEFRDEHGGRHRRGRGP
jgi:hypothetical protein